MKQRLLLLTVVLAGMGVIPASAQKPASDPRPLKGLRVEEIPTYRSIEEYMRKHPEGNLTRGLVTRGTSSRIALPSPVQFPLNGLGTRSRSQISPLRIERSENGVARWIDGPLGKMSATTGVAGSGTSTAIAAAAIGVIERYKPQLAMVTPSAELQLISSTQDKLGSRHIRFQQVYKGLPVWGRDLYLHTDARDEAYLLNGSTVPTPTAISTTPSISTASAFETVVADLSAKGRWAPISDDIYEWLDMEKPRTTLVIYPQTDRTLRLAYEVTLHPNFLEWYTYIVDATNGTILNRIAKHCSLVEHKHDPSRPADRYTLAPRTETLSPLQSTSSGAAQFFDATGRDLANNQRSFRVYQHTDNFFYSLWDLSNFSLSNSTLPNTLAGGSMALTANGRDLDNSVQLQHISSSTNNWTDRSGVSAIMNMKAAFDYYKNTFGRRAIDNNDQSMMSILHVTEGGQPMDNAFWNGRVMAYGDGASNFTPLAGGEDVAGHEMTHGVVQATADLIYQNQSGALNESFADVFGIMIDRNDFLLGEDIMVAGRGIALRDLANPNNPQVLAQQPAHMNQFQNLSVDQDNGGVHINSGIPNRAAFNLIQAIGREKTEQIYYRALSNYLVRDSRFIDARNAVERAATDLFGANEAAAVRAAFDAVGITGGAPTNPNDDDVPPLSGGTSLITFTVADGTIGLLNTQTGEPGLFTDPGAVARVFIGSDGTEDRAQLSTPAGGGSIWFVNDDGVLSRLTISTGAVQILPSLAIQNEGDLWNAVVSPDEEYVALVSAYENDANIYVFDGTSLARIPLLPESSQSGVQIETIQYPDVISWSPNMRDPRIAFDAFNQVDFAGGAQAAYWSMYEIDFDAERIYSLIPAQPMSVSVGNITYSNLDPDIVAFNIIDEQGTFDVALADFETGETVALGIPNGSSTILDAQRPTFAPDNSHLAFVSPANNAVFFMNMQSGAFSALQFQAALYNPHWFQNGGISSVGGETGLEAAGLALRSLPNPASGATTIEYVVPAAGIAGAHGVRLEVIDLYGKQLATLVNGNVPAGPGSVRFDTGTLLPGTYLLRLTAGGRVETAKMVVVR